MFQLGRYLSGGSSSIISLKEIAKAKKAWKGDSPVNEIISMSGFLGKAKGSKQISYERGLWKEGMMMAKSEKEEDKLRLQGKQVPDPSFYVDRVLGKCRDFLEEKMLWQS